MRRLFIILCLLLLLPMAQALPAKQITRHSPVAVDVHSYNMELYGMATGVLRRKDAIAPSKARRMIELLQPLKSKPSLPPAQAKKVSDSLSKVLGAKRFNAPSSTIPLDQNSLYIGNPSGQSSNALTRQARELFQFLESRARQ